MIDALIIGGGVSGLTAAYELVRRGCRVQLVERQARCGGAACSERIGGFLMEHGPSSIAISPGLDQIQDLATALQLDARRCGLQDAVKYRYLVKDGRPIPIPTHPLGFFTSNYLSRAARLRLLFEIFRKSGDASHETVAQFCDRRFGAEFTRSVIDPLVAGLYGGRAKDISLNAAFPALAGMEQRYGSLTAAVMARKMAGGRMPAKRLFSWDDGIASLPRALALRLGDVVRTGITVRRIHRHAGGFTVDMGADGKQSARSVIIAAQPHAAAAMVEAVHGAAANRLYAIAAPPISVVYLGYRSSQIDHELDGIGYLTPEAEGRIASGTLFPSTMFRGRAPEGHAALSVYIGGSRAPEAAALPQGELIGMARREVQDMLGAYGEPVVAKVRQWARGLPQLGLEHQAQMQVLAEAEAAHPGLYFTGNYFSGPGIARCIANAVQVSARAADGLGLVQPGLIGDISSAASAAAAAG